MPSAKTSCRWPNPKIPDSVLEMFDMHGKVVIITDGTGGIGCEVARGLAEAGADIVLWYHTSIKAEELSQAISKGYGVKCKAYKCSVRNMDDVQKTTNAAIQDFGRLDVMIANAGVPSKADGLDDKLEDWHRVVDIDFNGAYYCARVAGEIFRRHGRGNLIFTTSMSGHAANVPQQQACYNACKAGVTHLAKSLAVEWAGFARVNTVSPGYIDTSISEDCPFRDERRMVQPDSHEARRRSTGIEGSLSVSCERCKHVYDRS